MRALSWRVAWACSIGTSHATAGTPCQDFAACEIAERPEGGVLIVAASDGAGSASRAEAGSEVTATTLVSLARRYLEDGAAIADLTRATVVQWIGAIGSAIAKRAELDDCEIREYSCTLLGAIVGPREAAFVQIGDGAIVVSHGEADGWSYLFWPQHGEFANSTNFVTSPNVMQALEFEVAPRRINELALFTDGIENLVLHQASRSVHEPFFNQMFRPVRALPTEGVDQSLSEGLRRYLSGPVICDRTDDDKTLVLASRAEASEVASAGPRALLSASESESCHPTS